MKYLKEYYNYDNEVAEICDKYGIDNWSIRDGLVDVDGDVYLNYKKLTKLPLKFGRVSGYFSCGNNKLTTLEGGPKEVGGNFYCDNNQLTTLEGSPTEVGLYFYCHDNQLTTLEGGPKEVGGFYCFHNQLTTLEGGPKWVGGGFDCQYNQLTTLEHFPNVKGDINIDNNPLPKEIYDNKKYLKQIIENGDEYDIWRDGKLYLPRFRELLKDINW